MARRPRALCTIAEVKRLLPNYQEPTDSAEQAAADLAIGDWIDSASQRIYEVSGREFLSNLDPGTQAANDWPAPPTETREFEVSILPNTPVDPVVGTRRARLLPVGDMQAVTALQYGDPWVTASRFTIATTDYRAKPLVRAPWQPIRQLHLLADVWSGQSYFVTGKWGFPAVPMDVREACQEQVAIWTGRDLQTFTRTFLEAAGAGGTPGEPRQLAQSVYDVAIAYNIPEVG